MPSVNNETSTEEAVNSYAGRSTATGEKLHLCLIETEVQLSIKRSNYRQQE